MTPSIKHKSHPVGDITIEFPDNTSKEQPVSVASNRAAYKHWFPKIPEAEWINKDRLFGGSLQFISP